MKDFSFIRLEPTIEKAIETRTSQNAILGYFGQVQLLTTEKYTQITNTPLGIAFNGNYKVEVCNLCNEVILDITSKTTITEFTDNRGQKQIVFDLENIDYDFGKALVTIKFTHTVSDEIWYSNLICITDYNKHKTTRFDYRDYADFYGTAYNQANVYQSIRLNCFFYGNNVEGKSKEYTSIEGLKVTSRVIQTELEKYKFEQIDDFTYRRLNKLLISPVIYVNDYRVTNKQSIPSKEKYGRSNLSSLEFELAINYNEQLSVILATPPIVAKYIILSNLTRLSPYNTDYDFNYLTNVNAINFYFQTSTDNGVTWSVSTLLNSDIGNIPMSDFWVRIYANDLTDNELVVSNVIVMTNQAVVNYNLSSIHDFVYNLPNTAQIVQLYSDQTQTPLGLMLGNLTLLPNEVIDFITFTEYPADKMSLNGIQLEIIASINTPIDLYNESLNQYFGSSFQYQPRNVVSVLPTPTQETSMASDFKYFFTIRNTVTNISTNTGIFNYSIIVNYI